MRHYHPSARIVTGDANMLALLKNGLATYYLIVKTDTGVPLSVHLRHHASRTASFGGFSHNPYPLMYSEEGTARLAFREWCVAQGLLRKAGVSLPGLNPVYEPAGAGPPDVTFVLCQMTPLSCVREGDSRLIKWGEQ